MNSHRFQFCSFPCSVFCVVQPNGNTARISYTHTHTSIHTQIQAHTHVCVANAVGSKKMIYKWWLRILFTVGQLCVFVVQAKEWPTNRHRDRRSDRQTDRQSNRYI